MKMFLEISFGRSPSSQFSQAVRLAAGLPGYRTHGEGSAVCHQVTVEVSLADEAVWDRLHRLLRLVSPWRSSSIQVGGRPMSYRELEHSVARVKACYRRKLRQGAGDYYCSGKEAPTEEGSHFGCRLCHSVSRRVQTFPGYHDRNSWIQFGMLAPGLDSFRVDKQSILQIVQEQATQLGCIYCPAFSAERIGAEVNELPDLIALGEKSAFEVRYSEFDPAKALGIRPKTQVLDETAVFEGERDQDGVRQVPLVRYRDIVGQDQVLAVVKNVVQLPLTHPEFFVALGVEPQAGIILYGPPGNGKTLIATAVASECQAHLEIINGPEILSMWVGQSEAHLRRLFARARQLAPSVVLIDELDSIAPRRDRMEQQHQVQLIAQLLVLLDGLEIRGRVVVIGTTNRLEALDPAVCRPGRFDYHLEVPLPDRRGRAAILQVHLKKMKTSRLPIARLAAETAGYSGAELAALCREAGLQAIQRGVAAGLAATDLAITRQDLEQALRALRSQRAGLVLPGD